jgi:hypothetical protein
LPEVSFSGLPVLEEDALLSLLKGLCQNGSMVLLQQSNSDELVPIEMYSELFRSTVTEDEVAATNSNNVVELVRSAMDNKIIVDRIDSSATQSPAMPAMDNATHLRAMPDNTIELSRFVMDNEFSDPMETLQPSHLLRLQM